MKRLVKIVMGLAVAAALCGGAFSVVKEYQAVAVEAEREALCAQAEEMRGYRLILQDEGERYIWPVTYEELGIYGEVVPALGHGLNQAWYALEVRYDPEHVRGYIDELYRDYLQAAHDAYFQISYDNQVTIVPEQAGQALKMSAIDAAIASALDTPQPMQLIVLSSQWSKPAVKASDLESLGIESLLGEYSTRFNGADRSRTSNIWLASSKIEGHLLRPGETFSFNTVVGPRTRERGFSEAGVIINNEHGVDIGGGVCQVATTLYNAARTAGLTIVERHSHSLQVHYVEKGRDAAVVYGEKDLCFRNDTEHTVLITSYFAYGQLTFKIFG